MLNIIKQVFDITKEIQEELQQKNIERAATLQADRENLSRKAAQLSAPTDPETAHEIERLVIEIQKIDALMLPVLTEQMQVLAKERKQITQGAKMTKAYQST